jgi:hypothetical protein
VGRLDRAYAPGRRSHRHFARDNSNIYTKPSFWPPRSAGIATDVPRTRNRNSAAESEAR